MFRDKTLLITGGTGSFGNAVLRRFLPTQIGEIRIFSRDEKKQDDMRHKYNSSQLKFYIGDVRDFDSVNAAMRGVDFVFSAAALKQVPSCEFYPVEAVKTNVLGTRHGEKKHESLMSREEKTRAEDMENYYRIRPDSRDLNYKKYFVEGEQMISMGEDYTSANTHRLDVDQMVELLMRLEFIKQALAGDSNGAGV